MFAFHSRQSLAPKRRRGERLDLTKQHGATTIAVQVLGGCRVPKL